MDNVTLPERMKSSINQMTLSHLKIQQLIAKMRPAGILVDINGLQDIDLGLGHTVTPWRCRLFMIKQVMFTIEV